MFLFELSMFIQCLHILCFIKHSKYLKITLFLKKDKITYLMSLLNLTILLIPSVGKNVEQQEFSYIADNNVTWYSHFVTLSHL